MRKNATLVWSSEDHDRGSILVLDNTFSTSSLIDKIFCHTSGHSKRLTISKHKYFYAPSEEYKSYAVRYKRTR